MTRSRKVMPPPPQNSEKMLYEYSSYEEIPDEKKPFVRRFFQTYLAWVISQPQFGDDYQEQSNLKEVPK